MNNTNYMMRWDAILKRLPAGKCIAVEIGVWKASNALHILQGHNKVELYLIDRWQVYSDKEKKVEGKYIKNASRGKFKIAKNKALEKIKPFKKRVFIHETDSITAARCYQENFFDLIFLDAMHSYEAVKADIEAWLPKVKEGGYISGHDYPRRPGVVQAVNELFAKDEIITDIDNTWFVKVKK